MSAPAPSYGAECPVSVAIVVCNEVIEDRWTNNKTLVSLFNSIHAPTLPTHHARMFILASLTDGRGEWPVSVQIESPAGEELFRAEAPIRFDDPIAVHDLVIEVRGLPLPAAGEYRVSVLCGGNLLCGRRFTVVQENPEGETSG